MKYIVCLFLFLFSMSLMAADASQEREWLEKMEGELKIILTMANRAEIKRNTASKTNFDYDLFRKDVHILINGIQVHLSEPDNTTRDIEVLSGKYSK